MVVDGLQADTAADRVFQALADTTRRDILRRAIGHEQSVSSLSRHYEMSLTAVQKHVGVLERAGLISKHRRGREQLVRAEPDSIRRANELLAEFEQLWIDRINRIGEIVAVEEGATP